MIIKIPVFATQKETFDFLRRNKDKIKSMKKANKKLADGVNAVYVNYEDVNGNRKAVADKQFKANIDFEKATKIKIMPVINTTNLLDSHLDVHIPKLWNRSINDLRRPRILNQEHKGYEFEKIIADEGIIPKVELLSWKELGYEWAGSTEALIYPSEVLKERNEMMFKYYIKGWVKNHSVEMFYMDLRLCMNSDSKLDKEERNNWEEFRPQVVNGDVADEYGYFWAVTEAKEVGAAAVPSGSNYATPTQTVEDVSSDKSTSQQSSFNDTSEQKSGWELFKIK